MLDDAIQNGVFTVDSKTILDRATGEYRDINTFRLNRQHPTVVGVLESDAPEEGTREE